MKSSDSGVAETLRKPGAARTGDGAGMFAAVSVVGGGAIFGIAGTGLGAGGAGLAFIAGGCTPLPVFVLALALAATA